MDYETAQSALNPAGRAAEQIAELFYWMAGSAALIWCCVMGLVVYALLSAKQHSPTATRRVVIIGGALVPTVVLTMLLSYSLAMLPELQRPAPQGSLTIQVNGVMWWWRVRYQAHQPAAGYPLAGGTGIIESANEIRLPVGEEVEFKLRSEDVVHSFWIPALGGKMDMIPGRDTRLKLHPSRVGTFRGVCAEFCGDSHAHVSFDVIVMERVDFDKWFKAEQKDANEPTGAVAVQGRDVFMQHGCSACHAVRGTDADGHVGPDLTHFGARATIAAGRLSNDVHNVQQWIANAHQIKPGVQMPAFRSLSPDELVAVATYLEQLK